MSDLKVRVLSGYEVEEGSFAFSKCLDFDLKNHQGIYNYLKSLKEVEAVKDKHGPYAPEYIHNLCDDAACWCELASEGEEYEIDEGTGMVVLDIIDEDCIVSDEE